MPRPPPTAGSATIVHAKRNILKTHALLYKRVSIGLSDESSRDYFLSLDDSAANQSAGQVHPRHRRDLSKRHTQRRTIGYRAAEMLPLGQIETSMRATLDLGSLSDIVNFYRLSQPTTLVQIWLHHINVAILYQLLEWHRVW